jgi:hypothetical protein
MIKRSEFKLSKQSKIYIGQISDSQRRGEVARQWIDAEKSQLNNKNRPLRRDNDTSRGAASPLLG